MAADEGNGGRNAGVSGPYSGGALGLSATWQKAEKGATVANATTWQLGGSHDFKSAKVFAQVGQVDYDTTGNRHRITELSTAIRLGATGKVLLQWGRIDPRTGAERTTLGVGYDHPLSRRTGLYAVAMNDKLRGLATGNSNSAGVRHRF